MKRFSIKELSPNCSRMISISLALLMILILGIQGMQAQTIIKGRVQAKDGEAIYGSRISALSPKDSTIVAYAFSDYEGNYVLTTRSPLPKLLLSIKGMKIKSVKRLVENKNQTQNFIVEEKVRKLREVTVKARKIWGKKDTVNYAIGGFIDKNDVVIADVLKKLPGIEVNTSGLIKYKGKPINKFYIEGLDALQGRYGIATNNISAKDVKSVQVLENHQPVKALEDKVMSDQAAINLKLKDKVKGTFSMTAVLGLGYDTQIRRNAELVGMYFGKGRQHIATFKSNDNGKSIYRELRSFTSTSPFSHLDRTSLLQASEPSLALERYYMNDTHALSSNNLFKLKNKAELNTNLIYYYDKNKRHGYGKTTYYLPQGGEQIIEEDISSTNRSHSLETEIRYNTNKKKHYFNNLLEVEAAWLDQEGKVQTAKTIAQDFNSKSLSLHNTTHLIKRANGGRGFELILRNGLQTKPHRLNVASPLYPKLLNGGKPYKSLSQDVRHSEFVSTGQTSILSAWTWGDFQFDPTLSYALRLNKLETELGLTNLNNHYQAVGDDRMHNDLSYTRLEGTFAQNITYRKSSLWARLSLPLMYSYTKMENSFTPTKSLDKGFFLFNPSLSLKWEISSDFELLMNASSSASLPNLSELYTGFTLNNYRSLSRNEPILNTFKTQNAGFNLNYKDIFNMLFVGLGFNYGHYSSDMMTSFKLDGPLSMSYRLPLANSGQSFSANLRFSKGLDWKSLTISTDISASKREGQSLFQNELRDYEGQSLGASGKLSLKLTDWLSPIYTASWGLSRSRNLGQEWIEPTQYFNEKLSFSISLSKNLLLNASAEHYFNNRVDKGRHFALANAGLSYNYKRMRFFLDWTNILNTKLYTTARNSEQMSYLHEYDLRPMAVMLKCRFKLF